MHARTRAAARLAAVLAVPLVLASCGATPAKGTVTGTFTGAGGPVGSTLAFLNFSGTITLLGPAGEFQTRANLGHFTIKVPPGTYEISGRTGAFISDGSELPCRGNPVKVMAGRTVHGQVVCNLR